MLVLAAAAAHIVYLRFLCDDAFITFRYAQNLAGGHGFVFNLGERVEGYTNFSWLLLCAAMIRLGVTPELGTQWLGGACAILTLACGLYYLREHGTSPWWFALLLAANGGFAAWATGGLETALFTLSVLLAFLGAASALERRDRERPEPARFDHRLALGAAGVLLAALTRPEGLLVAGLLSVALATLAVARRLTFRALAAWAALWALPYACYFAWRVAYFGHLLPNTFAVKSGGTYLLPIGLAYLGTVAQRLHLVGFVIPLLALAIVRRPLGFRSGLGGLAALLVIPYLAFVALVGGDFMDLGRFVVPLLPIVAIPAALGWGALERFLAERMSRPVAIGVVALLLATYAVLNLATSRDSTRAWHRGVDSIGLLRDYRADWTRVARVLTKASTPSDTLAITAAGIIPYYTGLYTIDQLGLVADDLGGYRARRTTNLPGHGKIASGELIMRLRPQFLIGHPVVVDSISEVRPSLMTEPGWADSLNQIYRVIGAEASIDPPRYFALAVRIDRLGAFMANAQLLNPARRQPSP
ncbi:MAG TPA: hypothetical protein VEY91_01180 [Candidatus Limnocylindria bacterium]|nr:hypothetical protein [Candidatus Limnocylindria bacterium]